MTKQEYKQNYNFWRIFFYIAGMLFLACGITMNTKTGLGVSPIISVPYAISEIWDWNLGNVTLAVYLVFVMMEGLLMRKVTLSLIFQLPFSLVFTRLLNLFNAILPGEFQHMWENVAMLFLAIVFTGIGIVMSVGMRIIPNPADGLVQTISDASKKSMGFCKNCFDLGSLIISVSIAMTVTHSIIGIGIGTVVTMLFTGRAVAIFNSLCGGKILLMAKIGKTI